MLIKRNHCFACRTDIRCNCRLIMSSFCPIHTPSRYGELCFPCYLGFLGEEAGLTQVA